jgi:hypothetical protein
LVETEEASDANPIQPVSLGARVLSRTPRGSIHDCLGNEEAVDDMTIQSFMGVQVIALTYAQSRMFLSAEVEARVDLVLAVGEEEFHR